MVLKLYKRDEDVMLYWEAWQESGEMTIHYGQLGTSGDTVTQDVSNLPDPEQAIEAAAEEAREHGFHEIPEDELYELIVRYPAPESEKEQTAFATHVEHVIGEAVSWTGNGYCEGSDIGRGTIDLYCFVVDPKLAANVIVEQLREQDMYDPVAIAYQERDEQFVVAWPTNYAGTFEF